MTAIACIIHSLGVGGMERVMALLVNDFAERPDVEVHLVLIGRQRNVEFDLDKRINVHKPHFKFNPKIRSWHTVKTLLFIRKTIKNIQPQSILSFGEMWNNLVLLSLHNTGYPLFISDRSQPNKNLGKLHNYLRNWLYPHATGYIAQTSVAGEIANRNKWNSNIMVIGNPIRQLEMLRVPKEKIIITVGRLIPTKNVDHLINIFSRINKPNWRLLIIGGNAKKLDLFSQYKNLVEKLKMQDKILLLGEQKNIESYLARSSIFVFASSSEGFPNALAEAIAARLPVVAYDCVAGPSDLIENERNGFLVELHNDILFQQSLEKLMDSKTLRDEFANSSHAILKRFEVKTIANKFYNVLIQNK